VRSLPWNISSLVDQSKQRTMAFSCVTTAGLEHTTSTRSLGMCLVLVLYNNCSTIWQLATVPTKELSKSFKCRSYRTKTANVPLSSKSTHTTSSSPSLATSFALQPKQTGRSSATRRSGPMQEVEAVDLTEVNTSADLTKALSKQRQDAIQAQMKQNQGSETVGRTPLSSYKCPICMDTPEDATTTSCGHLFCHKCIIDTLRWSEEQRQDEYANGKAKGTCPVCRKQLARNDKPGGGRTLIPLELKLTARKKVDIKGKGVAKQVSRLAKTERENSAAMWEDLTVF